MYISHAHINSLNDQETIMFGHIVFGGHSYPKISKLMMLPMDDVRSIAEQIYIKFTCWPRSPSTLRKNWRESLELEQLAREQRQDDITYR